MGETLCRLSAQCKNFTSVQKQMRQLRIHVYNTLRYTLNNTFDLFTNQQKIVVGVFINKEDEILSANS